MELNVPELQEADQSQSLPVSEPFLKKWNQLVSTTNWEKGKIICQWRHTLKQDGFAPRHYSDESWSRQIGNVTPQHTGRLRKVSARFGMVWQDYPGLYWSHFFASLDWDDAELWLEGAIQNCWSISQMRIARSEARDTANSSDAQVEDILLKDMNEEIVLGVSPANQSMKIDSENQPAPREPKTVDDITSTLSNHSTTTQGSSSHITENPGGEKENWPPDLHKAFCHLESIILKHKESSWDRVTRSSILLKIDQLKRKINK